MGNSNSLLAKLTHRRGRDEEKMLQFGDNFACKGFYSGGWFVSTSSPPIKGEIRGVSTIPPMAGVIYRNQRVPG